MDFTPIRLTWTPCVANSWFYRLEKPISPRMLAHPLPSSPRNSRAHGIAAWQLELPSGLAFAKPTASRPACTGRSAGRTASHASSRQEARSAAPKVSSVLRNTRDG